MQFALMSEKAFSLATLNENAETLKTPRSWGLTLKLSRFLSYKYMHHVKFVIHSPFHVFSRVFHTAFSKAFLTHFTHFMIFWVFPNSFERMPEINVGFFFGKMNGYDYEFYACLSVMLCHFFGMCLENEKFLNIRTADV